MQIIQLQLTRPHSFSRTAKQLDIRNTIHSRYSTPPKPLSADPTKKKKASCKQVMAKERFAPDSFMQRFSKDFNSKLNYKSNDSVLYQSVPAFSFKKQVCQFYLSSKSPYNQRETTCDQNANQSKSRLPDFSSMKSHYDKQGSYHHLKAYVQSNHVQDSNPSISTNQTTNKSNKAHSFGSYPGRKSPKPKVYGENYDLLKSKMQFIKKGWKKGADYQFNKFQNQRSRYDRADPLWSCKLFHQKTHKTLQQHSNRTKFSQLKRQENLVPSRYPSRHALELVPQTAIRTQRKILGL